MKEEVLKRAMFAMPLSKEARNSGILSGFEEEMEDMDEMPEPSEEMPQMARNPQNPEILMNNLRGDMRSVDARYMELAQMVGEEAAMETPPEVLAMLQSQFAQQGGIGGLPQAQAMAPQGMAPEGMPPPPMMPEMGAMPMDQGAGIPMPEGMAGAPPFSQGGPEQAPPGFAMGGEVGGSGMLNLQVPISVGGSAGGPLGQAGSFMGVGNVGMGGMPRGIGGMPGGLGGMPAGPADDMERNRQFQQQFQQQLQPYRENLTNAPIGGMPRGGTGMIGGIADRFANISQAEYDAQAGAPRNTGTGQNFQMTMQGLPYLRNFADGGEVAPPTPDGLPPMQAAGGAFITPLTRFAQAGADKTAAAAAAASRFMASGNAAAGRLMSQGFPQTFRPVFENVRGPSGKYTAEQFLTYPTLTQHMANIAGPRVMGTVRRAGNLLTPSPPAAFGALGVGSIVAGYRGAMNSGEDPARQQLLKDYEDAYYRVTDRSIPMPSLSNVSNEELAQFVAGMRAKAVPPVQVPDATRSAARPAAVDMDNADFIRQVIEGGDSAGTAARAPAAAAEAAEVGPNVAAPRVVADKSRIERIREAQKEYAPLYKELLGDTKDDMYVNAMLMLADAGFKYASLPAKSGTTPISLLAQASQGLPQGFMALLAQAKDRQIKVDTAALSQAVSDVQEQDKFAQRIKELVIKGDYDLLREQAKKGGVVTEDGGAGLLVSKDKSGSFLGFSVDPNNPTVKTAISSRFSLRPTDNPFVTNRGEAPTSVETDKGERVKLTSTLRSLDNSLATLDSLKGVYTQAYGPGAWFSDKVNNLLVPVLPTATLRPNLDLTDASTRISTGMNSILKNIASANDGGRVAVQEQEWARETARGVSDPAKFFADKEVAAKQFNSMEAMLRNARQQVLTQLGYEKNDFVMSTPNTGTQSDPFVIPSDADARKRMYTFLGGTIGRIQDPRATVYLRMPNGTIQSATPTQLIGLMQ
jgi:hypothetical protein